MQGVVDDQVTSLWYLFNTHLAAYILLGFLVYAFIGAFWAGLFELVFPSKHGDLVFASSLSAIDIVIGFVYFIWLRRQMDGYTSGIRRYKRIITILDIATDKLSGMYDGLESTDKSKAQELVLNIKTAFQFLVFYSYKIFVPANKDVLVRQSTYVHGDRVQDIVIDADIDELEKDLTSMGCQIQIKDIPQTLLDLQDRERNPIKMSHEIRSFMFKEISRMLHFNLFGDAHIYLLNQELALLSEELLNIDTERSIVEPSIFDKHASFTLIAYFGSWLPISLWVRFSFWTAVMIYPFVMFVLTGPFIYRKWLGDPFSPTRPVVLVPHKTWRNEHIQKIERKFPSNSIVIESDME